MTPEQPGQGPPRDPRERSVLTERIFSQPVESVWCGLLFYEQITRRPPLLLRLLLPAPLRTEGRKSEPGDEVRCLYDRGHLLKRTTHVAAPHRYAFDVVEQELHFGGGIRLSGGSYELRRLDSGDTAVVLETRYLSPRWPRWLWTPLERSVCHHFHRHILDGLLGAVVSGRSAERPRGPDAASAAGIG